MSEHSSAQQTRAVILRTPAAIDQALREPALRVAGRGTWHADPRVHDLIDRMPSMHDDEGRRASLIPVRVLLSPDAVRAAAPRMRREMKELALVASQTSPLSGSAVPARQRTEPEMDLVESYTSLIAPSFLRSHLGLEPAVSAHDLRSFSMSLTAELVNQGPPDQRRVAAILDVSDRLRAFVGTLRRQDLADHPLDPLIAAVPDDADVAAVVCLLASGGQETVSSLTCSVLQAITQDPAHPAERDGYADRWHSDPVAVVDELARLLPPIMMLARRAEANVEIDGIAIEAGRTVLMDVTSASAGAGLAFGMGLHRCLGRSVARAIIPIAVDQLLETAPHLREATFRASGSPVPGVFRGPTTMFVSSPTGATPVWDSSDVVVDQREA